MFSKILQLLARVVVAGILLYLASFGFNFSELSITQHLTLFAAVLTVLISGMYPFKEELYQRNYLVPIMNFMIFLLFIEMCYDNRTFIEKHILLALVALFIIAIYSTFDIIKVKKCRKMIEEM